MRIIHFFFSDRQMWSNHYWGGVEWIQEMLSHTYHDPISCLDLIFEFVNFFLISFFMHILLRETLKRSLRSCFQLVWQNFSSNLKKVWYQKPYRLEVWRCSMTFLSRFSLWFMRFWAIFQKIGDCFQSSEMNDHYFLCKLF